MEEVFTRPGGKSSNISAKDVLYLLDEFDHALKELLEDNRGGFFSKSLSLAAGVGGAITNTGPSTVKIGANDPPSVHSIKAILDGALNVPGRVVIATSNTIEKLMQMGEDSSFLRARRMECIYVGLCDQAMFRQFWRRVFGDNHPLEDEVGALPADLVAPAEVSSVLLSCYGKPELALSDLRKIVAAKLEAREAAKDDKAESGKESSDEAKEGGGEEKKEGDEEKKEGEEEEEKEGEEGGEEAAKDGELGCFETGQSQKHTCRGMVGQLPGFMGRSDPRASFLLSQGPSCTCTCT